jgi:hypothetical protein
MSRYVVKSPLNHNNKPYEIGKTLELTDEEAAPLLPLGVIELFELKKEEDENPVNPSEGGEEKPADTPVGGEDSNSDESEDVKQSKKKGGKK